MQMALRLVEMFGLTAVAALATSWRWKAHADHQPPTVLFCLLVRNKAHVLPYFFGYLEELDYPKDRIAIFIRIDHSIDQSVELVRDWTKAVVDLYHSIELSQSDLGEDFYAGERGPFDWTEERYNQLTKWKEHALTKARRMWADFIFFLDCDVLLFNQKTLQQLMAEGVAIVAPMLVSLSAYSNFWAAVDEDGFYQHSDDYDAIYGREKVGCFPVPMVHSAVLIDLRMTRSLKINFLDAAPKGHKSDLRAFATSVESARLRMYVSNRHKFGAVLIPPKPSSPLEEDFENLRDLMVEALHSGPPGLLNSPFLPLARRPPKDRLGFDRLFLINLERRADRKARMDACFDALGLEVDLVKAVDGATLSVDQIRSMGVRQISEYRDPYHKRPMTTGEVGCFLSHYSIWKRMVDHQLQRVIVFEDDLRFRSHFRQWVLALTEELANSVPHWDLVYLGRKQLNKDDQETLVDNCTMVGHVGYSYWTLAYLLTLRGAQKLLAAEPLGRLVPVDEFLPIMFDRHPVEAWKNHFAKRDLNAYTSVPLLVYPVLYVGQEGYVSDTENTTILQSTDEQQAKQWHIHPWSFRGNGILGSGRFDDFEVPSGPTLQPGAVREMGSVALPAEVDCKLAMSCLWSKVLACVHRGEVVEVDERKFRVKKRLGDGQFSCVYLVQERGSGHLYALKRVICHSKADEALVENEIHVHDMTVGNVNLLPCEGYSVRPVADYEQLISYNNEPSGYSLPVESTTGTEYNILLPYYRRGTIQDELRWRLSSGDFINEKRVRKLFRDICHGLSGLHNLQPEPFIHGDLTTGNVLLSDDDDRAVLMDFGSSRPARIEIASEHQAHQLQDLSAERCTMYYRAPELFAPQVGDKLDERTDIWSLGCLLYALCFWVSPFEQAVLRGDSLPLMHLSLKQVIPIHSPYSKEMHDLIMCMLQPDRESRPFLSSVLEKLEKVETSAN